MAKQKRTASDLDAELAALEAELAALEGKPKKAKAKPTQKPKPEPAASASEPGEASPDETEPQKKSRFALPKLGKSLPKLGKRKEEAAEPEAPALEAMPEGPAADAPEPAPAAQPGPEASRAAPHLGEPGPFDPSVWRQDGDAWVRVVPDTPVPVVRRVLDESGELVREEAASQRDVDDARGVKAERGIGRLLRRK